MKRTSPDWFIGTLTDDQVKEDETDDHLRHDL